MQPAQNATDTQKLLYSHSAGLGAGLSVRLELPYAQVILSSEGVNGTREFLGAA